MRKVRPELLDFLRNLKVEAYTTDTVFAMRGPTWIINAKTSLEDFLDDFVRDEHGALRDYAAVPTHALTPFFQDADILDRNAVPGTTCPIDDHLRISPDFKPEIGMTYFFAGDLSVSGDRTGIAMAHYNPFIDKIILDFSKAVDAPKGSRVDYGPIRTLIMNLRDRGFHIKTVAFDQFQSNDSINQLTMAGFNAIQVNYADSFVGCIQMHELIHTDRLVYGADNTIFIGEAKELQIVNSKRIDHLMSDGYYNSKDVWDATVNAVTTCLDDYYKNGLVSQQNANVNTIATKLLSSKQDTEKDKDISWLFDVGELD